MIQQRLLKSKEKVSNKAVKLKLNQRQNSYSSTIKLEYPSSSLIRTSSIKLNSIAKTPEKEDDMAIQGLTRNSSWIGLSEYKLNACNKKNGISPGYVDYSEVIRDCDSKFTREIITPNKSVVFEDPSTRNEKSCRRTREMRSNASDSKEKNASKTSHTPKSYGMNRSQMRRGANNSYANYSSMINRSHTPWMYNKKAKVWEKKTSHSSIKPSVHKDRSESTAYIVNENVRLRLHKASRTISMKHLGNLISRSTPEIRQIMQIFCLLLNALKKKEYRAKPSIFKNWNFLWEYIKNHNCTILAEVIAVANKIERELYDYDALMIVKDQFETIEQKQKLESSHKVIHNFVHTAILFFSSKMTPSKSHQKPPSKINKSSQNHRPVTSKSSFLQKLQDPISPTSKRINPKEAHQQPEAKVPPLDLRKLKVEHAFESCQKYESEREEELMVSMERMEERSDNGFRLELMPWDVTSNNSSSAMTPRIMMQQEKKGWITKEMDFTEVSNVFTNSKLSKEQIERVRELTMQRKMELDRKENNRYAESSRSPSI
jgi:hypothetical protein